jgi:hypothetical protein
MWSGGSPRATAFADYGERVTRVDLVLRSRAQHGVSKDGHKLQRLGPSFETPASRAPQDEV